jgi:hypothetical protein
MNVEQSFERTFGVKPDQYMCAYPYEIYRKGFEDGINYERDRKAKLIEDFEYGLKSGLPVSYFKDKIKDYKRWL